MNKAVARYMRALKRKLPCSGWTRKTVMARFQTMLDSFLEDHPDPAEEALYDAFGTPEDMAKELASGIPQDETARFFRKRQLQKTGTYVLLAAILVFAVYVFFFKETAITCIDKVYQINPPYSQIP